MFKRWTAGDCAPTAICALSVATGDLLVIGTLADDAAKEATTAPPRALAAIATEAPAAPPRACAALAAVGTADKRGSPGRFGAVGSSSNAADDGAGAVGMVALPGGCLASMSPGAVAVPAGGTSPLPARTGDAPPRDATGDTRPDVAGDMAMTAERNTPRDGEPPERQVDTGDTAERVVDVPAIVEPQERIEEASAMAQVPEAARAITGDAGRPGAAATGSDRDVAALAGTAEALGGGARDTGGGDQRQVAGEEGFASRGLVSAGGKRSTKGGSSALGGGTRRPAAGSAMVRLLAGTFVTECRPPPVPKLVSSQVSPAPRLHANLPLQPPTRSTSSASAKTCDGVHPAFHSIAARTKRRNNGNKSERDGEWDIWFT